MSATETGAGLRAGTAPATTVDTRAQTVADLRAAANVLRRRGWTRHTMVHPATGRVCAAGAIQVAIRGDYPHGTDALTVEARDRVNYVHNAAHDFLVQHTKYLSLIAWNDDGCGSGEQAAELFEAAAAELDTEGGDQ